jgi:hypothetical protein
MKHGTGLTIGVAAVVMLAAGGGYWLGHKGAAPAGAGMTVAPANDAASGVTANPAKKLLYYRNPHGPARHLAGPEKRPYGHGLHRCVCGRR